VRSGIWLRIVAIVSLILWWAIRGKFAVVVLGGGYFIIWLVVALLSHVQGVFFAESQTNARWILFSRRCIACASIAAVPGFFLGFASHNFEEKRARAFVEIVKPTLMEYYQTNGHFPETIESIGFKRPRVDLMKIGYSAGESGFIFSYPNSLAVIGNTGTVLGAIADGKSA
jgi:hypothetical protein